MKNIAFLVISFLLSVPVMAQKDIVILQTNDTHSQIYPFSKNLSDKKKADRGGYLRRAVLIDEQRKQNPDLLLFDSGDFSQGSTYYTIFHGDVEIELMNKMGYDAATIGNHEFDFGLDNMARIFKMAHFPIVCSNYDFTGTPLEGIVKPYTVIKRNGVKIGVFGICPKLDGLVTKANYGAVKYNDPIATANEMAQLLKNKEKCDIVVCLSHLGWKTSDGDCSDDILVPKTSGIDLVLGGHTHTVLNPAVQLQNAEGKNVSVSQNGKSGLVMTRFDVHLK